MCTCPPDWNTLCFPLFTLVLRHRKHLNSSAVVQVMQVPTFIPVVAPGRLNRQVLCVAFPFLLVVNCRVPQLLAVYLWGFLVAILQQATVLYT